MNTDGSENLRDSEITCVHCDQLAQYEHRRLFSDWRGEWREVLCPECEYPACVECCAKVHEGEMVCKTEETANAEAN